MTRPSFEETFMRMAEVLSLRSSCNRLKVGCIITTADHQRILSGGYNGDAPGRSEPCDPAKVGACCDGGPIHAEENAITAAARASAWMEPKHVFVTDLPCALCAKKLIRLGGVKEVYFRRDYRVHDAMRILNDAMIGVTQLLSYQGDPSILDVFK